MFSESVATFRLHFFIGRMEVVTSYVLGKQSVLEGVKSHWVREMQR